MFGAPKSAETSKLTQIVSASQEVISQDPLVVAANFVTLISGARRPNIWLTGLREPTACASRTGAGAGVSFRFDSEEGVSGIFYFFPDFASAQPDGEASARPPIPTKMIIDRVAGYADALDALLRTVPRPPDLKKHLAKDPALSALLKYL